MDFKHIKIFFYILFVLDILAGLTAAQFFGILHGIIVSAVLLILNVTVYVIILKIQKVKEHSDGYSQKRKNI
jgi:hypothetical protein